MFLFADDMVLHIVYPEDSTKKLLGGTKFTKVAGCKINVQKAVAFLCTNNYLKKDNGSIYNTIKNKTHRNNIGGEWPLLWKPQSIPNSQSNPEKGTVGGIPLPDFKLFYKAMWACQRWWGMVKKINLTLNKIDTNQNCMVLA